MAEPRYTCSALPRLLPRREPRHESEADRAVRRARSGRRSPAASRSGIDLCPRSACAITSTGARSTSGASAARREAPDAASRSASPAAWRSPMPATGARDDGRSGPPWRRHSSRARRREDIPSPALAEAFLAHGRTKRGRVLRPATVKEYRRALLGYADGLHDTPGDRHPPRRRRRRDPRHVAAEQRRRPPAMRTRAALARGSGPGWSPTATSRPTSCTGTEGYDVAKRSRVLSDGELAAIWAATEERHDFNLIVRLCLWTGCRRSEAGGMRWSELAGRHLDRAGQQDQEPPAARAAAAPPGARRARRLAPLRRPRPRVRARPERLSGVVARARRGSTLDSASTRTGICTTCGARCKPGCSRSASIATSSTDC